MRLLQNICQKEHATITNIRALAFSNRSVSQPNILLELLDRARYSDVPDKRGQCYGILRMPKNPMRDNFNEELTIIDYRQGVVYVFK